MLSMEVSRFETTIHPETKYDARKMAGRGVKVDWKTRKFPTIAKGRALYSKCTAHQVGETARPDLVGHAGKLGGCSPCNRLSACALSKER